MSGVRSVQFLGALRSIALVAIGVVVGSLVVQGAVARESASVTPAATTVRWASCPSVGFFPHTSTVAYDSAGDFSRQGTGAYYHCAIELPDGATITGVRFTVLDTRATGSTGPCYLGRMTLTGTSSNPMHLSGDLSTSVAGTPGRKVLTDTTITNAVVDNSRYAYWIECYLELVFLSTGDAGIYGGAVSYRP